MKEAETQRVCRCGCGAGLRSRHSEFAPGHHARVVPHRPGGGLTPIRDSPALCECGCGVQVKTAGARWLPGHNFPRGRERCCPTCGTRQHIPPSRQKEWRACSLWCQRALRNKLVPWNPLQTRCREWMWEKRLYLTDLAAQAGATSHHALREWFYKKGATISAANIAALADHFGITPERALEEAGGMTSAQRLVARGQEAARKFAKPGTPEFLAKQQRAARARRRSPSPEASAKRQATKHATGGYMRALQALHAANRTPTGRARISLYGRLQGHPTPPAEDLRQWAAEVGARIGLSTEAVLATWRPLLVRRGLVAAGGRRADTARCQRIRGHLDHAGITPETARAPYGFWKVSGHAEPAVKGGKPAARAQALFWQREHRCTACLGDRRLRAG